MIKKIHWPGLIPIFLTIMASGGLSREYVIYTITQEISMGLKNESLKKNFYVNIGKNQGVEAGTMLDVFRTISKADPYNNFTRHNYNVKIGELKVIHSEENSSITQLHQLKKEASVPLFEIPDLMIGDMVNVHLDHKDI